MAKKRRRRIDGDGLGLTHRILGENLKALMDDQIADLMRDPAFRRTVQEFNLRMFRLMAEIAERQVDPRKR